MVDKEASDLYLRTKAYPRARINGKVETIGTRALTKEEMSGMTNLLLGNEQSRRKFLENFDIDFIYEPL
jgi:Tfp pilus assembly pilus retraction ATPase PilT